MKNVSLIARTLFPVAGRERAPSARRPGGLLQPMLAIGFALAPLVILAEAIAQTA